MQAIRLRLFRRSVCYEKCIRTHHFKLPNNVRTKCHKDCCYQVTGKYFIKNFRHYSNSNANSSNIKPEERISTPAPELLPNADQVSDLSDDELMKVITQLRNCYIMTRDNNLEEKKLACLAAVIDHECVHRAKILDLETILQVVENYFPKGPQLCPNLLVYLMKKKYKKALKSPIPTLMKFLNLINMYKFWRVYYINPYFLEYSLERNFNQLTVAEISSFLVAISLARFQLTSEQLMVKLLQKLTDNIDTTDNFVIGRYLHFFNNQFTVTSRNPNVSLSLNQLLNILPEKIPDLSFRATGKAASLYSHQQIYNPRVLDNLARKLIDGLPNVEVTSLEEMVATLVFFNYNSRDIYQKIIDNFEIEPLHTQLIERPKRLVKIACQLCLLGIYHYDYINTILSKEFLHKTFGKKLTTFNVPREVLIINDTVKIDCPDYKGNRLDDLRERLRKNYCWHLHECFKSDDTIKSNQTSGDRVRSEPSPYNKVILEARNILQSILGGPKFVHTCYLVPSLPRPNLMFFFDKQKNPTKIPENILNSFIFESDWSCQDSERYVVFAALQHPILKRDNYIICGKDIAKVRLLKKFGFHLIIIIKEKWFAMNEKEKCNYLNELIR